MKKIDDSKKVEIINYLFNEELSYKIYKYMNDGRMKDTTKIKHIYDLVIDDMKFYSLYNGLLNKIESDCKKICELINNVKSNPELKVYPIDLNTIDQYATFKHKPIDGEKEFYFIRGRKGVYVFVMDEEYDVSDGFDKVKGAQSRNNVEKKKFLPTEILYVGKAKSFLTRMGQHFCKENENSGTGSLKLLSEARKGLIGKFTVYAFEFRKQYANLYDIAAVYIENYLHDNLHVLVGKK